MKIAVCLSGQIRYWDSTYPFFEYWNNLFEDVEFTFFVSTWNTKDQWYSKDKFQMNHLHNKYKGLVLFDIDDTLTTGLDNYNVVQYCIDEGWAVGICTAGSIYNMDNLKKYPYNRWMPSNL